MFKGAVEERSKGLIEEIGLGYKVRIYKEQNGLVKLLFFRNGGRRGEKVFWFDLKEDSQDD